MPRIFQGLREGIMCRCVDTRYLWVREDLQKVSLWREKFSDISYNLGISYNTPYPYGMMRVKNLTNIRIFIVF